MIDSIFRTIDKIDGLGERVVPYVQKIGSVLLRYFEILSLGIFFTGVHYFTRTQAAYWISYILFLMAVFYSTYWICAPMVELLNKFDIPKALWLLLYLLIAVIAFIVAYYVNDAVIDTVKSAAAEL